MIVEFLKCVLVSSLFVYSISYTRVPGRISQFNRFSSKQTKQFELRKEFEDLADTLSKVAVSGFVSLENNFADAFPFQKLFDKTHWKEITAITDDLKFARKRLVTPNTVYSGLIDEIKYEVIGKNSDITLQNALNGKDSWLAFNVTSSELKQLSLAASAAGLKRVVFGVNVSLGEFDPLFEDVTRLLTASKIAYTIIKYTNTSPYAESTYPYRIVRGELPVPTEGKMLASQDLYRVLLEVLDIPKTYNGVYGIGPGGQLDSEILAYMKAQGWPERVQVGLLMGDLMERIETKYLEEIKNQSNKSKSKPAAVV